MLEKYYNTNDYDYEICIDEVGRGCLFGDVVIASSILPKPCEFSCENIKDSKKFTSKPKLFREAEHIKENMLHYHIASIGPNIIDEINILQAVMEGMHQCAHRSIDFLKQINPDLDLQRVLLLIDGNYFKPFYYNNRIIPFVTVKQGDGKYVGIAAASILAKAHRDNYIYDLCEQEPKLHEYYHLKGNVGYAAKVHREGIMKYGITKYHRKTFGELCRRSELNDL
jgi:ribonuclease HII